MFYDYIVVWITKEEHPENENWEIVTWTLKPVREWRETGWGSNNPIYSNFVKPAGSPRVQVILKVRDATLPLEIAVEQGGGVGVKGTDIPQDETPEAAPSQVDEFELIPTDPGGLTRPGFDVVVNVAKTTSRIVVSFTVPKERPQTATLWVNLVGVTERGSFTEYSAPELKTAEQEELEQPLDGPGR